MDARCVAQPGKVNLADHDPDWTGPFEDKSAAKEETKKNIERMQELQWTLYAENKRSLLIILQAMDAAGKDGTIRHVLGAMNPQGCTVASFKQPSAEERDHDFLWRIHREVPRYGEIGVFNRSHYEDVLIVRVHNLVPEAVWRKRYEQINRFEQHLADNQVHVLKFFLHISKAEQKERFQARLDDPTRNWKFSEADIKEREHWDDYQRAYEDAIGKCAAPHAPWYVIPANKKWFRNLAVSSVIVETMEAMHMKLPAPSFDPASIKIPD